MATIRVTQQDMTRKSLMGLQSALARVQRNQEELSTGKSLLTPSDDPAGAADALRYRAQIRRNEQFQRNVSNAQGWLNTADNALTSSLNTINRIRELVLQGVNATTDSTSRSAMANEIGNLKEQLISLANSSYGDRPIFAGTNGSGSAYDPAGVFQGNDDPVNATIGPGGETIQINLSGNTVFGTGATQLFTVVQDIIDHLNSGTNVDINTLSTTDLANLDTAKQAVQISLSTIGARAKRVDDMALRLQDLGVTAKSQLSLVEDADIPRTIMELQANQMAYQSALAATSKVIQPSLVDFLR